MQCAPLPSPQPPWQGDAWYGSHATSPPTMKEWHLTVAAANVHLQHPQPYGHYQQPAHRQKRVHSGGYVSQPAGFQVGTPKPTYRQNQPMQQPPQSLPKPHLPVSAVPAWLMHVRQPAGAWGLSPASRQEDHKLFQEARSRPSWSNNSSVEHRRDSGSTEPACRDITSQEHQRLQQSPHLRFDHALHKKRGEQSNTKNSKRGGKYQSKTSQKCFVNFQHNNNHHWQQPKPHHKHQQVVPQSANQRHSQPQRGAFQAGDPVAAAAVPPVLPSEKALAPPGKAVVPDVKPDCIAASAVDMVAAGIHKLTISKEDSGSLPAEIATVKKGGDFMTLKEFKLAVLDGVLKPYKGSLTSPDAKYAAGWAMKRSTHRWAKPAKGEVGRRLLGVDTNVLMESVGRAALERWLAASDQTAALLIPQAVLCELDGLKKGEGARARESRDASRWLEAIVARDPAALRFASAQEERLPSGALPCGGWQPGDVRIANTLRHFAFKGANVALVTNDRNLALAVNEVIAIVHTVTSLNAAAHSQHCQ